MNKRCLAVAAMATIYCFTLSIVAADEPKDIVIVTATRTAQTADETLVPVTVITRKDIERSQAKSVAELLSGSVGIDTNVSGGFGKATNISVRGTNADHVVVLVDGVRLGSATLGTAPWQYLPVEQIERIEIVRGPRSSLYGADAIGGVIQIFTRKGKQGFRAGAEAGIGTFNTHEYAGNIAGANGGFHYSAAAAHFKTDGINARTIAAANEPDNDGYYNKSFTTRMGYRFKESMELDAHVLHAEGNSQYDGTFTNETDFIQNTKGAQFRAKPTRHWTTKVQVAHTRDETDDLFSGTKRSNFNTDRRQQSWQNDLALTPTQLLTLGVDRQTDLIQTSSNYRANSRDNTGYYAQHQATFGEHDLLLGLRRDDNQVYGSHDTGNLAWGWNIVGERLRTVASYGTAFKAPTFNQLYSSVGNPDIKPEKSESYEIGLRGKETRTTWAVHAFQTNVDNLIVFQPPTFQAININKARIRGLENELSMQSERNRVSLNLTFLDPRDVDTDMLLPRRPKRTLKVDEEYKLGRWHLGATWLAQSYRYDNPQNTTRMGGYGAVDLHARVELGKYWFVKARVGNIFDKQYETAATYNSYGRHYYFSAGYQYQ